MKKAIFILMAVFTILAFGSFVTPDDDVGDPVTIVDVTDIDVVNIQLIDVATMDDVSIKSHSVDVGIVPGTITGTMFKAEIPTIEKPDDDVGWMVTDESLITTKQPPNQNRIGSAGGNPGWCV